ncbi:MAG: N-acetyltransferase [Bacteroidales bacterium]|nr:N-acetyltransferase [Bacteroidales bacterium]MDD4670242.1 N-acetyltransferase [Bacteroidales bacterium]
MNVIIKEVSTKKDLKQFVKFPNRLYKNNKYYVPQLVSAEMDTLDRDKNHAFEFCESKYWLAYDDNDNIVGRVAGIVNHAYNKKTGIKFARFGWLDFIDDDSVVEALFNTVEQWAKDNHLERMTGPLGLLEFDASGVLVEGFEEIPTAYGKYNFPYYEDHILKLGYVKDTDWVEYRVDVPEVIPPIYARAAKMVAEKEKLHVAHTPTKKIVSRYFDQIFALMNRAYSNIHGYSELSQGQIDDLKAQFLPQINMKFVAIIVDENDKVVAFGVCLPSISKALQKAHGKLFPFGFIHLLKALRKNDTLDTLLISVEEEYKNKGLNAMIFDAISNGIRDYGIKYVETTRELEDNHSVQNLWNKFDTRLHKRARCYIKNI